MTVLTPDILEKLRAIRDRTERGKGLTDAELQNNVAIFSRMLRQYNLDVIDLDRKEGNVTAEGFDSILEPWQEGLLWVIADANFCKVLYPPPLVVGEGHNIAVVRELYDWLSEAMPEMAQEAMERIRLFDDTYFPSYDDPDAFQGYIRSMVELYERNESRDLAWNQPDVWLGNYLYGMVEGLKSRLQKDREQARDQKKINALVPLLDKETQDYIDQNFDIQERRRAKESGILKEGYEAGQALSLDPQLRDAKSHSALKG